MSQSERVPEHEFHVSYWFVKKQNPTDEVSENQTPDFLSLFSMKEKYNVETTVMSSIRW